MIDLKNVEKYRENNRIEAKKALGGLPKSIWETYSAFANTLGGVILLGVEEYKDKTFHVIGLPDPFGMAEKFRSMLKNKRLVSADILSDGDVTVEEFEGKRFVAINVPRAHRFDKPVYIEGNIYGGTYRRGGEGDYRCQKKEVDDMLRDAARASFDMIPVEMRAEDAFNGDTFNKYRQRLMKLRSSYLQGLENDFQIAEKIGVVSRHNSDEYRPSTAGLLMFGKKSKIKTLFPFFSAVYKEKNIFGETVYETECENLFEFYLAAEQGVLRGICLLGISREEERAVFMAISEALANSVIHADIGIKYPITACLSPYSFTVTNPGSLRIAPEAIFEGSSDKRNGLIAKMLSLVSVGGGGVRGIYEVWRKKKWCAPILCEDFSPDRVTLMLVFGKECGENKVSAAETFGRREAIISYITENIESSCEEIAKLVGISNESALLMLEKLSNEGVFISEKRGKTYYYKLKS